MIWDEGDANPLHRRIPGEVVFRRRPVPKKTDQPKELEEVVVDLKTAILMKPEARLKWLTKACKMVSDQTASSTDVYDIVVNRKFVAGMPERVVRKISTLIQESLDLFSEKQRRYLSSSECPIQARLVNRDVPEPDGGDGDDGLDGEPADEGKEAAPPPPREKPPPTPAAKGSSGSGRDRERGGEGGSSWQVVKDEWSVRRQEAEKKEQAKKDSKHRREKERDQQDEEEAASRRAAEAEAERKRKLEEEADNLFDAVVSAPPPLMSTSSASAGDRDRDRRRRSLSRSRSISSRTARRMARQNQKERAKGRGSWRAADPEAVSGSRAIFMNRDFIEDLPHMPRPMISGIQGRGGGRSRSRERRRRQ